MALLNLAAVWNLAGPGVWWDEGWTLSVARNWVERGHYGRLLNGQLWPPGLEAAFPVTAPIALSFRLFGVGIWQGRIIGVEALVVALILIYELARRLYNRRVAIATVLVLLFTPMHPQLHPLIMGRQVLAEVPMFGYLLAGYLCFFMALGRSRWMLVPAIICWALGMITKIQSLPFWIVSLLLPLMVALIGRNWKAAGSIGVGLVGALLASRALLSIQQVVLQGHTLPVVPISGIYDITALVLTPFNRLFALQMLLILGLPTLAGLLYALWRWWRAPDSASEPTQMLRLALLGLAGSWLAWYALLSVGVPRYLFPATFFGSLFVAALLHDLTYGFDLKATAGRAGDLLKRRFGLNIAGLWAMVPPLMVLFAMVAITLMTLNRYYLTNTASAGPEVAAFLNTQTPPGALIETYESEIQFLLDRRYHYPPDQLHIDLNHRSLLHEDVTIDYDPLAANPDYLVVGQFARENGLYQPVIDSGAFRLLRSFEGYLIYQRVR